MLKVKIKYTYMIYKTKYNKHNQHNIEILFHLGLLKVLKCL